MSGQNVRIVLNEDGVEIDTDYYRTLDANEIVVILGPGEQWTPPELPG